MKATFTNKSEETNGADTLTMIKAFNEDTGVEIERAFEGTVSSDNYDKSLRPNASVEFEMGFYVPKGEKPRKIMIEITEAFSFGDGKIEKEIMLK